MGADRTATASRIRPLLNQRIFRRSHNKREKNPAAAVFAIKEKGILSRKRVERSENGEAGEFDFLDHAGLAVMAVPYPPIGRAC
jgi:hypothetical protein